MMHTVTIPPDAQIESLLRGYTQAIAARRRQTIIAGAILIACFWVAGIGAEVNPQLFWNKIDNFSGYFGRLLHLDSGDYVWTDPAEWFWGMVFALIFVVAFGLGALPGVLAIAIHTTGALGKLFAEVVENIDMKPVEGIAATGGSWFAQVRFGAVPQVLSNFASYSLLRFEVNVRGAAVIGIVGAGGIGQEFIVAIRQFHYSDVSAILLMIVGCVMLIDGFSERVRHRLLAMTRH